MAVSDLKHKAREALKRRRYELAVEAYTEYLRFEIDDEEAVDGFFQAAHKLRETRGKSLFGGVLGKMSVPSSKDPMKRIAGCLRALAKAPDNKAVLMMLGDAAMQASAFQAGIVAYKRAAEADPEDNEAWKRLGDALGRQGRIREALDALGEAVRIKPRDQEALKLRKNLAAEGALKATGFETAGSSRDLIKDKEVVKQLEMETRLQLTPEHASSEIEKVQAEVEANPEDSRLRVRLADLLQQQGEEDRAMATLEEAARLDPENYDLSVRVGDMRLGRLKREYQQARDAMQGSPDDGALKAKHDEAHGALVEASLVEYRRRVREHPLDLMERFRLGNWLFMAGNVDEALAEFQQTVKDPHRKVDSLLLQAKCFEKKNITKLAAKKLEEAVKEFPTLASPKAKSVYYDFADLLERTGDAERAREIFERIVEEDAAYKDVLDRLSALSA
jgi:tetratricopeptide (TPR) repeat protein